MSNCGAQGSRRLVRRKGELAKVFAGRSAHAGLVHGSKAVRAALGCWLVPFVCRTQVLKNLSKLESLMVGSPIRSALPVGRLIGRPERKLAIQLYSQPPSSMLAALPAPLKY